MDHVWERSVSEPSNILSDRKFSFVENECESFPSVLEKSQNAVRPQRDATHHWAVSNGLIVNSVFGGFTDARAEFHFARSLAFYADSSGVIFLLGVVTSFVVAVISDLARIDSCFDVGQSSRWFRLTLAAFYIIVINVCLYLCRRTPDFFSGMSARHRLMLALFFTVAWFIYFPTIHSALFAIPINPELRLDTFVTWTYILLQLTTLCGCASLRLRIQDSALVNVVVATETAILLSRPENKYRRMRPSGIFVWCVVNVLTMFVHWVFDRQARARFIRDAREIESATRITANGKRMREIYKLAAPNRKADLAVQALTRLRDDPDLANEPTHKAVLSIGISSFASETDSSRPQAWTRTQNDSSSASPTHSQVRPDGKVMPESEKLQTVGGLKHHGHDRASVELKVLQNLLSDWDCCRLAGIWSLLGDGTFPIFQAHPLVTTVDAAINRLGIVADGSFAFDETKFLRCVAAAEAMYLPSEQVPYHNARHATDVVQTLLAILCEDAHAFREVSGLGLLASIFAAAVHDLAHPGVNNAHLIATENELALTYNDRSILENFHVSRAFALIRTDSGLDFLRPLREKDIREGTRNEAVFRSLVIDSVLATDLSHHFSNQVRFRARLASGMDLCDYADASLVLSTVLHAADIANVGKAWAAYEPWINLLFSEFFAQGDLEKSLGLPVAPFMNRDTSVPERAQIAFISNIALPLFAMLSDMIPTCSYKAITHINDNLTKLDRKAREKENATRVSPAVSLDSIVSQTDDEAEHSPSSVQAPVDGETSGEDE